MATLYTCGQRGKGGKVHPCGRAIRALDEANVAYEVREVGGYRLLPWTRRGERDEVREVSGQEDVPVFVADDGEVVSGSGTIARWAAARG